MKGSLVRGTLILAGASFFSRLMGSTYRILLPRIMGDEGVGLYHMAYYLYALALFFITPGIPLAISRLIAKAKSEGDEKGIKRLFFLSFCLLLGLGSLASLLLFFGADILAEQLFHDPRVAFPLQAIAPAVFFVSLMALFRGFFQGMNTMLPTALSQIFEQSIRVGVMLALLYFVLKGPVEGLAAGAAFATVCGEAAGFFFILYLFARGPWHNLAPDGALRQPISAYKESFRDLLSHALPLSLGSMAIPFIGLINSAIIPRRLQEMGMGVEEATGLYGQYSGMAMVLYFFPLILTTSLAISLVPALTESRARGDSLSVGRRINRAMGLTLQSTFPAAVGFMVLGTEITELLFGYGEAGSILAVMAPSLILLGTQLTLGGALQGLGYIMVPVRNLALGALVNGVSTYFLVFYMGINGAALGTALGFSLAGILNIIAAAKRFHLSIDLSQHILVPLLGSLSMGGLVWIFHHYLSLQEMGNVLTTLLPILMGAVYYFFFLVFFRGIDRDSIEMIPLIGEKLHTWVQ